MRPDWVSAGAGIGLSQRPNVDKNAYHFTKDGFRGIMASQARKLSKAVFRNGLEALDNGVSRLHRWIDRASMNRTADREYARIVQRDRGAALDAATEARIRAYCGDVFGNPAHAPWLRVFTAVRGAFHEGWIPYDYYVFTVLPAINGRYRSLSNLRSLQGQLFGQGHFPDLAASINGRWFDTRDGAPLLPEQVEPHVFADHDTVFVKTETSLSGKGVRRLRRAEFDAAAIAADGDSIVQAPIRQHPAFDAFMADSVTTMRVTTVRQPGEAARMQAAYLRMGRKGESVIGSETGVKGFMPENDGVLGPVGAVNGWQKGTAHPDSGKPFEGFRVPCFDKAVMVCQTLHDRVPQIGIIGWDVAIDAEERVQLMEWNGVVPGIKFEECFAGPSFATLGWQELRHRRS